jgi:hypothetical protein
VSDTEGSALRLYISGSLQPGPLELCGLLGYVCYGLAQVSVGSTVCVVLSIHLIHRHVHTAPIADAYPAVSSSST